VVDETISVFADHVTFVNIVNFATTGILANNENDSNYRSMELSTEITKITGITRLTSIVVLDFDIVPLREDSRKCNQIPTLSIYGI